MDLLHFVYHSSINGLLDCFQFGAIMNSVAVNIHIQVPVWTCVFISLGYIPRSGVVGSYGNCIFSNHLRNCQTIFENFYTILHSHQQCKRVPVSPCQHLLLSDVFGSIHPSRCEVAPHCVFCLHFSDENSDTE